MVCSLGKNTQETVIQTFQNLNLIGDPLSGNYPVHNTEEFDQANWELSANLFQSQNLMGTFWVRTGNQAMFNRALAQLADVVAARQSDGNEQYTNGYTPPVTPRELVGGSVPDGTTSSKERIDWYKRLGLEMLISEAGNHETSESLLRGGGFSTEALDLAAFGVSNQTVSTMMPGELSIKWKDDMLNPPEQQRVSGLSKKGWAETVDLTQPIEVSYDGKKFYIEDGHHRYYAAKILGKPLSVNLEITASPIPVLTKLGYDQFHRSIFDQAQQRKSLPPSDKSVNLQNGKEQNSRTGTSTGDTGQVRYNGTDAIGERGRSESEKDASRKDEANSEFQFADQKSLALPAEFTDAKKYFKVQPAPVSNNIGEGGDVDFTAKGGNKAVDKKGNPITLYRAGEIDTHIKNDRYRTGRFFTTVERAAEAFGSDVKKAIVIMINPLIVDAKGAYYSDIAVPKKMRADVYEGMSTVDTDNIAEWAYKNGYDGVIIKNVYEGGSVGMKRDAYGNGVTPPLADDYVVFNVKQIKSVQEAGRENIENAQTDRISAPGLPSISIPPAYKSPCA